MADEGLLRALSAEWLQRTGRSPLRELDLAVSLAQKAAEKLPADMDVRSAVAQTWVRVAQVKLQRKLPVQADVDRGLALVGRLLAKAPKWPRALAAQGLLLRVRAKSTRGAVAQQAAQQAAAAMRLMGQGNPLLLKFYASEIADIDRLAGPAVTGLTSL